MHPHFRSPRIALAEKTNKLSHVAGLSARDRPNFAWKLPRESYALDPSQSSSCTIGLFHPGVFGVEIASPGNTSCPVPRIRGPKRAGGEGESHTTSASIAAAAAAVVVVMSTAREISVEGSGGNDL